MLSSLKNELARLFIISFGVFLFILFFQPFPLDMLDYNNRLLYVTGFGAITFIIACTIYVLIPIIMPKWFDIHEWESGLPFILNILYLVLTVTAFIFYIRYVGKSSLSLYVLFKVVLVCLLPLIILLILYKNKSLERIIEKLQEQNRRYYSKLQTNEKDRENGEIEILSENKSDKLRLKYAQIVSVKSANNYTEINYLENNRVIKKLLRNTLKNIETQLSQRKIFIRCHRTSLVNVSYIDKLFRSYSGYSLKLTCCDELIPVARQYVIHIKDALSIST